MRKYLGKLIGTSILALSLAGCSTIDNVDDRTSTMNKSISEAENAGILLNVIRASLAEPLSFSSLANYTGHQTVTTLATFPNLGFSGAGLPLSSVQTSGLSITGSLNNDFSYVANDDNATYAALLQPISPATIGYFLRQEYPRPLLFFLMISQIRVVHNGTTRTLVNEGLSREELDFDVSHRRPIPFQEFGTELQNLLASGLTTQIDIVTGSRSKFCFDRALPPLYMDRPEVHASVYSPDCAIAKPIPMPAAQKPDSKKAGSATGHSDEARPSQSAEQPFIPYFEFTDTHTGDKIQIYLRSAFGIYRYVGLLLNKMTKVVDIDGTGEDTDPQLVTVTHDSNDCFVAQRYRENFYCVPNSAFTTKRIFALLHDLVKLYTFPTAAPTTITARLIPGG